MAERKKKCKHGWEHVELEVLRFVFTSDGQYISTLKCKSCDMEFEGFLEKKYESTDYGRSRIRRVSHS